MLFRAFCAFVLFLWWSDACSAECNYSEQKSFLARVVAVDSSGGFVYPFPKANGDPPPFDLRSKEVVLTFDQGPHPVFTGDILSILDRYCVRATFFFSGAAALADPDAVRDAARRGHTLAAGLWSASADLATLQAERAQAQIEKGFAAIAKASGAQVAPFFRVASPGMPSATFDYLKERGISLWYADIGAEPGLTPAKLTSRTLSKIREMEKGVIQFNAASKVTAGALDGILSGLKESGFKVVQIVPAASFAPKEEAVAQLAGTASSASRSDSQKPEAPQ